MYTRSSPRNRKKGTAPSEPSGSASSGSGSSASTSASASASTGSQNNIAQPAAPDFGLGADVQAYVAPVEGVVPLVPGGAVPPVAVVAPPMAPRVVGDEAAMASQEKGSNLFVFVFKSTLDILSNVIHLLKVPFTLFLVTYTMLFLFGHVIDAAAVSLAPICAVFPGFSACHVTNVADAFTATFGNLGRKPVDDIQRVDFPQLMALQSRTLDQLLTRSAAGSQLALGVKHAELAVKDLVIVVKGSNLAGRQVLSKSLEEFAQGAKEVGRDLQLFSAKLYGVVDTVLAFDEHALRALADSQASDVDAEQTAVEMFKSIMAVLSSEVARVIVEASTVAAELDSLEEKLYNIRMLSQQELTVTEAAVGDVLSQLWTVVGGNKAKLYQLTRHVDILRSLDWYRNLAVAHVVATTETLLTIEAELSELRDKLSAPELASDAIPLEVHIASIERGATRLNEGKIKFRADVVRLSDEASPSLGRPDQERLKRALIPS